MILMKNYTKITQKNTKKHKITQKNTHKSREKLHFNYKENDFNEKMPPIMSNYKSIFDVGLDALLKATCKMNCRVAFCTQMHQCMFV